MNKKMDKIRNTLKEEHNGFAITLEVIATLAMMTVFLVTTLYILRVMNVQRYMNTVLTSTAAQASRWGGVNSKAFRDNISSTPLLVTAQEQLNYVAPDFNAKISGNPSKISYNGETITIRISYGLPPVFDTMSKVNVPTGSYNLYNQTRNMKMSVTVHSIMEAGKLL